ncbi:MAG: hypothetical protein ACXVA9_01930 [Bdellovibrionales bacterium]
MQDPALKTGTTSASYLDQIKKLGPALGIGFNVRARTVNAGDGNVARLQSDIYSPLLEILPHASVLFLAVADMGELLEDGQPRPVLTNGKSVGQHTAIGIPRIDDPSVIDLIDPQAPHWDGSSARIIPVTDANGVRTARLEGNGNSARFFKPFEDLRVRTFFAISGLRSLQPK